jgi:hypothetical protein
MKPRTIERSKYWWLWPEFLDEKDARDAAKMGVTACGLIAIISGLAFVYRYFDSGEIGQAITGVIMVTLYSVLGYGIFKMSGIASSIALVLFGADKLYSFAVDNKALGIGILLIWYLVQANRAIYWFRNAKKNEAQQ